MPVAFGRDSFLNKFASDFPQIYAAFNKHGTIQTGTTAADTLYSFKGNDTLKGNGGSDSFFFNVLRTGRDIIIDFDADNASDGHDRLVFTTRVFADAEAVLAAAIQVGDDTIITIDAANTITLKNVARSSLDLGDILVW